MKKTILFLAANPKNTEQLLLGKEAGAIEDELLRAKYRDRFEFISKFDVSPDDLRKSMLEIEPTVVHFSGHGDKIDGLIWMDDQGGVKLIPIEALGRFFELFPQTECVLLNACYSSEQAEVIAQSVQYVIGMTEEVSDEAAREFAKSFYSALGSGKSVEFAYKYGSNSLSVLGLPEEFTPALYKLDIGTHRANDISFNDTDDIITAALEPVHETITPVIDFINQSIRPRAESVAIWLSNKLPNIFGVQLKSNIQKKLWLQWLSSSIIGFFLASIFTNGGLSGILGIFTSVLMLPIVILIISSFQWHVIKTWIYPASLRSWSVATAIGWTIGYIVGVLIASNAADDAGLGWGQYPGLNVGLTLAGIIAGFFQGRILNESILKISIRKWVLVNAASMFLGSLLGGPVLYFSLSLFAIILGGTYGVLTGIVILPYLSSESNRRLLRNDGEDSLDDKILSATNEGLIDLKGMWAVEVSGPGSEFVPYKVWNLEAQNDLISILVEQQRKGDASYAWQSLDITEQSTSYKNLKFVVRDETIRASVEFSLNIQSDDFIEGSLVAHSTISEIINNQLGKPANGQIQLTRVFDIQ